MRAAEVRMWARREGENAWPDCICMTDPLAYTVSHSILLPMTWTLCCRDMTWGGEIHQNGTITFPRSWEEATISAAMMYEGWLNVTAHILKLYVFHIVTVQSIVPCRRYSDWRGLNWWRGRVSILVLVTLHGHFHETNPWRTKLMLLSSRCLSVHVSHTSGVYTKPFQHYWQQKWPGLLAEMTWSTSRDDNGMCYWGAFSVWKPCDFCLCDRPWY